MSMHRHGVRRGRLFDSLVSSWKDAWEEPVPRPSLTTDAPGRIRPSPVGRWNGPCTTLWRWNARRRGLDAHDAKSFGKTTVTGTRGCRRDRVSGARCRFAVTRIEANRRPTAVAVGRRKCLRAKVSLLECR